MLASILVFIGYKLCKPKVWIHMAKIGKEQFVIFATTVVVTVSTDLLLGIAAGVGMKFLRCVFGTISQPRRMPPRKRRLAEPADRSVPQSRRVDREFANGTYGLYLDRPLVCFNLFHLIREMDRIPREAKAVKLQITDRVTMIDHTTCENLFHYMEQHSADDGRPRLEVNGLDDLRSTSRDKTCIRLASGKRPMLAASAS